MFGYLRRLKLPANLNDFVDLLSKTIFAAAAGIVAVVVWVYSERQESIENSLDRLRNELSDDREEITLFVEVMPKDESDTQFELKIAALSARCTRLNPSELMLVLCENVAQANTARAARAGGAAIAEARANPDGYSQSDQAEEHNRAVAATEASPSVLPGREWFAVVASVPLSQPDAVPALASSLSRRLMDAGLPPLGIYETKLSKSFALTAGGPQTEEAAKELARRVRQAGIARDAFPQPNKSWTVSTRQ